MNSASSLTKKLSLPVMQAPMFLISGPDMVVNACRAGIIGSFPTQNARTPEILDQWLGQINTRLDNEQITTPWAVNLITHPTYARGKEDFQMILKHKPPIVITALGSPAALVAEVHNYGGIVLADVINPSYAKKAVTAKVDGLVLVSTGAGGHTGYLSPFVFVQEIRKFWQGLLVLGGGIGSGEAVLATQAMGADIAYLGTRFIPTDESLCQTEYKQMVVDSDSGDVVVSDAITGVKANWLRQSLINGGYNPDNMPSAAKINFASAAGTENKRWKDIWAAGQGVASSTAIQPISEVVETLKNEYQRSLTSLMNRQTSCVNTAQTRVLL
ncbi:MAG: nitronate monooxygenase [Paraglaciecola sp.]|uniref:NAD(P)H-dependent flavin oxidoreductase n=1 Tax=Paraglaciecola sp. TaxID=1920173 RepID=UPI0032972D25